MIENTTYECEWITNVAQEEIAALKKLVREMAPFVRGGWCEEIRVFWPDWTKADEILNRPEVKAILEEVDGG